MVHGAIKIETKEGYEDHIKNVANGIWKELMKFGKIWDIEQAHLMQMFFMGCGVNTDQKINTPKPLVKDVRDSLLVIFGMASAFDMISDVQTEKDETLKAAKETGILIKQKLLELIETMKK